MTANIVERLKNIIVERSGNEASKVTPEARLYDDLDLDSLDRFELAMEVEKEFNISIPDECLETFITVGDVIKYLEGLNLE